MNFGNPEKPEKMGEFYEACRGLGDAARALKLPFMSGNVSFYNESKQTAVPPTPQITGIGVVEDIRTCVTSDFKTEGNFIYLVGAETKREMGGSEYYKVLDVEGGKVPRCRLSFLKKCIDALLNTIDEGFVAACHDLSEGGLGVSLSEMCIGGAMGCICNIDKIGMNLRSDMKLFSESNTRWIMEIKKEKTQEFEEILSKGKIPFYHIGKVDSDTLKIFEGNNILINQKVSHLDNIWRKTIPNIMIG